MSLILAMFLVSTAAPASGASAHTTEPASRHDSSVSRVDLEIDASALLEHQAADAAEDSAFYVLEDATKALSERHGVQVVDDVEAPAIIVRLSWKDYEGFVYRIAVAVRRPGAKEELVEEVEARCIDSTALSQAVVDRLPAALERLGEEAVVPDVEAEPADEPFRSPVVAPQDDREGPAPFGTKGKVGIGLFAAGAVGLVSGGLVFRQGRSLGDPQGHRYWQGTDFRPAGIAVMATSAVVAVTGTVLFIIDRTKARRARRVIGLSPWPSPMPGLVLVGRF